MNTAIDRAILTVYYLLLAGTSEIVGCIEMNITYPVQNY